MPEKDNYSKNFLSNRETQADIINYFFFDRKRVIKADQLHERDSVLKIASPEIEAIFGRPIERRRDLLFAVSRLGEPGAALFFAGCENQSSVDKNMPYRALEYDFLGIAKQYDDAEKGKKDDKEEETKNCPEEDTEKKERRKEPGSFKPRPVITFAINLSGRRWTGPLNFVDTLDFELLPKDKYPLQYKLPLLDPWGMTEEELNFFRGGFGALLRILARKTFKEQFHYATVEIPLYKEIQDIDILKYLKRHFKGFDFPGYQKKGEKAMSEAAVLFAQELKQEGIVEGIVKGKNEGISEEKIATVKRMFRLHCSINLISKATELSAEEVEHIIQSIKEKYE